MHARMTTLQLDPDRLDEVVATIEEEELPEWRSIDGFKGFTLVINRTNGKVVGTSYWDSREAMDASEDRLREARQRAAERGRASGEPEVELFEVALDTFV